jgi:hypothetical protein
MGNDPPIRVVPDPLHPDRPDPGHPAVAQEELLHRGPGKDAHPFRDRLLDLPRVGRHRVQRFQACHRDFLRAEPDRYPGSVERNLSPADHRHASAQRHLVPPADTGEKRQGVEESRLLSTAAGEANGLTSSNRQEDGLVSLFRQALE